MADEIEDPASRVEALLGKQAPRFAAGFQILVGQMKDAVDLNEIAELLQRGRLDEALTEALRRAPRLGTLYMDSYVAAAKDTASFLGRNLEQIVLDFDQTNPFSVRQARDNQLRLVNQFTQQQRRATREALIDGVRRGANPLEQARAFRDSIGLTERQVRAVNNYRRLLTDQSAEALDRALRDRRFDRTVRSAINSGKPLTSSQIENMVGRYHERYIKYRSQVIARTEALRSVHQGKDAMYRQSFEDGTLNPDNVTNEWNTARDDRVRDTHTSIHGQVKPFGEPFITSKGNALRYPTDPEAPAEESIQCRCALGTRITNVTASAGFSVEIV